MSAFCDLEARASAHDEAALPFLAQRVPAEAAGTLSTALWQPTSSKSRSAWPSGRGATRHTPMRSKMGWRRSQAATTRTMTATRRGAADARQALEQGRRSFMQTPLTLARRERPRHRSLRSGTLGVGERHAIVFVAGIIGRFGAAHVVRERMMPSEDGNRARSSRSWPGYAS